MEAAARDPAAHSIDPSAAGEPSEIQAVTLFLAELVARVPPPLGTGVWSPNLIQLLTAPGEHTSSEEAQLASARARVRAMDVVYILRGDPSHYTLLRVQAASPSGPTAEWFDSLPAGHSTSEQ